MLVVRAELTGGRPPVHTGSGRDAEAPWGYGSVVCDALSVASSHP